MQQRMMRYAQERQFEGGSENNCLHLFLARYTKSEEALQMFKKAFDKYLLASVTIQAVCTVFAQRCNEEAYRTYAIETHASFAASFACTTSIQLNDPTLRKCVCATKHGFDGCDGNKCLQIFIARYTNHSHAAIEKLRHSLDKYVFISVFLKFFCNSYIDDDWFLSDRRNNTTEMLRPLKDGMDLLSSISSQPGKEEPCIQTRLKSSTARQAPRNRMLRTKVDSYAKDVIDTETNHLKPKSWKDRQSLHEAVANGIVQRFSGPANTKNYRYEALAYLPYGDDQRHAFIKLPVNVDVVRNDYASVNYVVTRRLSDGSTVTNQWTSIEKNANDILEATFSTRATNLTSRVKDVEERFGPFVTQDGFKALVALRCGYEFVWYQLGYSYFPAGYATGNHTLFTEGGNKYSHKCGQIVFFP